MLDSAAAVLVPAVAGVLVQRIDVVSAPRIDAVLVLWNALVPVVHITVWFTLSGRTPCIDCD